jgi:hypothetical protein
MLNKQMFKVIYTAPNGMQFGASKNYGGAIWLPCMPCVKNKCTRQEILQMLKDARATKIKLKIA